MSVIREFAAAGIWPILMFLVMISAVTGVALCRADRDDIPRIFEAFAAAFGFHRPTKSGNEPDDGAADGDTTPPAQGPDSHGEEAA